MSTVGGSVAAAKANGSHASVSEQSGIKAGDGGFDVSVKGSTDLKGGVISSTQAAIDDKKNSFQTASLTTSDIENHSTYKAGGYSVSGSVGLMAGGAAEQQQAMRDRGMTDDQIATASNTKPGGSAGVGSASGSQTSTTKAGIAGIAGDTTVRSDDTAASTGALVKNWDTHTLIKDVQAQTQITAEFGQRATSVWGNYSNGKLVDAINHGDQEAIVCWSDGGACRVAGYAVIGGLGGGAEGAIGAGAGASAVKHIGIAVSSSGLSGPMADAVVAGLATTVGYVVSGATGASGAFNEVTNNYLSGKQVREMLGKLQGAGSQTDRDRILNEYSELSTRQSAAISGCVAEICQALAADARDGKQALNSMKSELAKLAGESGIDSYKNLLDIQNGDRQFFISLNYGWIDAQGDPIDISERMKAGGKEMADNVSKGASYAAAGCAALIVCAPAAPGIAAAGCGAGIPKDLVFDRDATAFFADFGVDKVLEKIGNALKIPPLITVPIAEGIKGSKEYEQVKNGK